MNINPTTLTIDDNDHQRSILSGVYYVDCEGDNIGNFVIERDDHMEFFGGRYQGSSPICVNSFNIKPLTGFLFVLRWTYHSD